MIGQNIGHYEIRAKLGQGGMGVVYRARDTRLNRDVAIKVLPVMFAGDEQRMGRFSREAQVLASLNHPNIAFIYGLESVPSSLLGVPDGETQAHAAPQTINCLVMELVEGEDLSERIARGPIPYDEALPIALQIAEGLESAHEKGIIHRDLKPANIKLTPDGKVKVLDFGLAKALEDPVSIAESDGISKSPTLSIAATQAGMILGTAAYMSPEQARGQAVDRRSDIWAFGCVLYEILSGSRAFSGDTVSDTLAAILKVEPDWAKLPDSVPGHVRRLLRRCLAKDPKRRLRDVGDVRLELADTLSGIEYDHPDGDLETTPTRVRGVSRRMIALATAAAVLITAPLTLIGVSWFRATPTTPKGVLRTEILHAEGGRLSPWASAPVISPDGKTVVYAVVKGATSLIYLRRLDEFRATPLDGTEGGWLPFFSPDGAWLGFTMTGGAMYKVPVTGGERTLVSSGPWWGPRATWVSGDKIVSDSWDEFPGVLAMVDVRSGTVEQITAHDVEAGEAEHRYPEALPDGSVIFSVKLVTGRSVLARYFPSTDSRKTLGVEGSGPFSYLRSGHLVYQQAGVSVVASFNLADSSVGTPVPVLPDAEPVYLDVSAEGTAVYVHFPAGGGNKIVRVDRSGNAVPVVDQTAYHRWPRLSPDGRRIAVGKSSRATVSWVLDGDFSPRIWTIDLVSSRQSLLQDAGGANTEPVWTPDGTRVAYSSGRTTYDLYWQESGGGTSELLSAEPLDQWATSFSADGSLLMFYGGTLNRDHDIWIVPVDGSSAATAIVKDPGKQWGGRFHPQGNWIVYSSMDTGRPEIVVRKYPELEPRYTVSSDGGVDPSWSPDGKELFYLKDDRLIVVAFDPKAEDPLGAETTLFEFDFEFDASEDQSYDIFPDGQHFVMLQPDQRNLPRLRIVAGFSEEVSRLLSANPRKE